MTQYTRSTKELLDLIRQQEARIAILVWNEHLNMLNSAGLNDAIEALLPGTYAVVFADIDRLKTINCATGSHIQTNRYLRDGLRVRRGEIAGQLLGDEFVFILPSGADAAGFCARIARQLAEQPLSAAEQAALEAVNGPGARLSATFDWMITDNVWRAIEALSVAVLAQKSRRDGGDHEQSA
jgi:GGDEF domain-containing protein